MKNLVERYVQAVGRFVPRKERAEIQAEVRSMILDQLEARYGAAPSEADVVAVLKSLGEPRKLAVSYSGEQYLVGPGLYPTMMQVLRIGVVIVPIVLVGINVISAFLRQDYTLLDLFLTTVGSAFQGTFIFAAVVVFIFAMLQHFGETLDEADKAFNPAELPAVDDPASVDRFETIFSLAVNTFFVLVLAYFISVGGLTFRIGWNNPADVIPAPIVWMVLAVVTYFTFIAIELWVLRRNAWSWGVFVMYAVLELFGVLCLYFVVLQPLIGQALISMPELADIPAVANAPIIIALIIAVIILIVNVLKGLKLWGARAVTAAQFEIKPHG